MKHAALIIIVAILLVSGCAKTEPMQAQYPLADEKAENILEGLNRADYAMFSRDLSDSLRQTMDEQYMQRLGKFIRENSGEYVAKALAASKDENSMHTLSYDCQFSLESVYFTITFNEDYSKVEGIYFDSINMRKALGQ